MNHLLIFYTNRYEKIVAKYQYHEGKWFMTYLIAGISIPIIVLWIGVLYYG